MVNLQTEISLIKCLFISTPCNYIDGARIHWCTYSSTIMKRLTNQVLLTADMHHNHYNWMNSSWKQIIRQLHSESSQNEHQTVISCEVFYQWYPAKATQIARRCWVLIQTIILFEIDISMFKACWISIEILMKEHTELETVTWNQHWFVADDHKTMRVRTADYLCRTVIFKP